MSTYRTIKFYLFIVASIFLVFNNFVVSMLTFIWLDILLLILTLMTTRSGKRIFLAILGYSLLLATQICFVIFVLDNVTILAGEGIMRVVMTFVLLISSIALGNLCEIKNYQKYFFHTSSSNAEVLPLGSLTEYKKTIKEKSILLGKAVKFLTKDNIIEILAVINKNNSFNYINDGTLDVDFFNRAKETLDDPYIYIVLSDTGSVPSKLIALFTDRSYNHSSLSFDKDLNTLVSYNGGEYFQPPGLNAEMIEFLSKKDDATVYVYRLFRNCDADTYSANCYNKLIFNGDYAKYIKE